MFHFIRFKKYSSSGDNLIPQDLDSSDHEKRSAAFETVHNLFKETVNVSTLNVI